VLKDRAVLLVLDDLWQAADAQAFDVLGPRCRAVVTTRDAGLITTLGGTQHQVQLLDERQALNLLAQWAEKPEDAMPAAAREVMAECGRLPLALAICGAMVRDGDSWEEVRDALRRDIHFIARHAQDYPQALFQCLWNTCWWYDCPEAALHYEEGRPPGLPSSLWERGRG